MAIVSLLAILFISCKTEPECATWTRPPCPLEYGATRLTVCRVARVAPDWPVPSLMHRRRVLWDCITYVGLDVHKDGIVVAIAEGGGPRRGAVEIKQRSPLSCNSSNLI